MLFKTIPDLKDTLVGEHTLETPTHTVTIDAYTLRNKRTRNEDACTVGLSKNGVLVAAVLDGLGGHPEGHKASHCIVHCLDKIGEHDLTPDNVVEVIRDILEAGAKDLQNIKTGRRLSIWDPKPDTTLVLAVVFNDQIRVLNVGDSLCFVKIGDNGLKETIPQEDPHTGSLSNTMLTFGDRTRTQAWYTWALEADKPFALLLATDGLEEIRPDEIEERMVDRDPAQCFCNDGELTNTDNCTAVAIYGKCNA